MAKTATRTAATLEHSAMAKGARIERAAMRRFLRGEYAGSVNGEQRATINAALDWLAGRAKRTARSGGVGRRIAMIFLLTHLGLMFGGSVRTVWAAPAGLNLVQNGSFTDGNTGFGSDYTYHVPNLGDVNLWDPGVYTVDPSAAGDHGLWETSGGHDLTGHGQANPFMIVNGETEAGKTVWRQVLAVDPFTEYFFEAFAKNLCCATRSSITADLTFLINGIVVGTGGGTGTPGVWQGISNVWRSGDASRALLEIQNGPTIYDGNDFGLDDIYLGRETTIPPVPEPMTLVMLGTGLFGLVGARRRRAR